MKAVSQYGPDYISIARCLHLDPLELDQYLWNWMDLADDFKD
jgi:hypothetical protein